MAAVVLAAGLAVSGCTGGNPKPTPLGTPTASTSISSTPSVSPTPPELPAAAKGTSAASAKAFARHYVELVNYASKSGNISELSALGTASCESCAAIAKNVDDIYSGGGSIESDGWKLQSIGLVPQQPHTRPVLDLGVLQSPELVRKSQSETPKRFDGGKQPMTMHLIRDNSGWKVARLDLVT